MKLYKCVCAASILLALVTMVVPADTDGEFGERFGSGFSIDSEFDSFGGAGTGPEISGSLKLVSQVSL